MKSYRKGDLLGGFLKRRILKEGIFEKERIHIECWKRKEKTLYNFLSSSFYFQSL